MGEVLKDVCTHRKYLVPQARNRKKAAGHKKDMPTQQAADALHPTTATFKAVKDVTGKTKPDVDATVPPSAEKPTSAASSAMDKPEEWVKGGHDADESLYDE